MISYTITVCNEDKELDNLLNFLEKKIKLEDEIVIQMDTIATTSDVRNVIENYRDKISNLNVIEFPLDRDFAKFKNNLKKHCNREWIFNIDADEIPSEMLIENMHNILTELDGIEMVMVPRWNIVNGITENHIRQWGWRYDEHNRVNWPDYQTRLYRNNDNIVWKNKVHERLTGYDKYAEFPAIEDYCLYHTKDIERQEKQNKFYQEI
jgi:hypothetical protein